MGKSRPVWRVRDKRLLLLTMMELLAGDAHVSFEGYLEGFSLCALPGVSELETDVLKRGTLRPQLDFVVAPLEPSTIKPTISALGGTVPKRVIHIQIEKSSRLQFGAYDNFYCLSFGEAVSPAVIEKLAVDGVIKLVTRQA